MKSCFFFILLMCSCCGPEERINSVNANINLMKTEISMRGVENSTKMTRRPLSTKLYTNPLGALNSSHPQIGSFRGKGSLSIGTTRDGFIVGCKIMPLSGEYHRVLKIQSERGTNCGTDELVSGLLKVAKEVALASPKGGILTIGNISRVGGGDIPWSISHNSGRDVDIGFYLVGQNGQQVFPDGLVSVDGMGKTMVNGIPARFDIRRNWLLVRSILRTPELPVQWMFISKPLKKMLIEYAKKIKEPKQLIEMANQVLVQPIRAKPHDDHLHLRIYCSKDDVLEGCQDKGVKRPWFKDYSDMVEKRVRELLDLLHSNDTNTKKDALLVIGRMGIPKLFPKVAMFLLDENPELRLVAAQAVLDMGIYGIENKILHAIENMPEGLGVFKLLQALMKYTQGQRRIFLFQKLILSDRVFEVDNGLFKTRWHVGEWAVEAIAMQWNKEAVQALISAMRRYEKRRDKINQTLMYLTGQTPKDEEPLGFWQKWWARNKKFDMTRWHIDAIRESGLIGPTISSSDIPNILEIIKKGDHRVRAGFTVLKIAMKQPKLKIPYDAVEPLEKIIIRMVQEKVGYERIDQD